MKFCELHRQSAQAIDAEFIKVYNQVIKRLSSLAQGSGGGSNSNNRTTQTLNRHIIRESALRALTAAAAIETFVGEGSENRLRLIWSSIVANAQEPAAGLGLAAAAAVPAKISKSAQVSLYYMV